MEERCVNLDGSSTQVETEIIRSNDLQAQAAVECNRVGIAVQCVDSESRKNILCGDSTMNTTQHSNLYPEYPNALASFLTYAPICLATPLPRINALTATRLIRPTGAMTSA